MVFIQFSETSDVGRVRFQPARANIINVIKKF